MRTLRSPVEAGAPRLSVLVPYYHDDPSGLVEALAAEGAPGVDIHLWDDGTADPELTAKLGALVAKLPSPVTVHVCNTNAGRSAARNALVAASSGKWILFLDADMRPSSPDFLRRYLNLIDSDAADVVFGGFEVEATGARATDLHRELSKRSDCAPAQQRAEHGPQHVASSNLCVRRSVILAEPFDGGFTGWGWEDSEWAARVARSYRVEHVDNPALHLGLESDDTLLSRFATSGPNYARFAEAHPDFVSALPLYRHARRLGQVPGQALARPILKASVKTQALPIGLRVAALKLWRASHYAEVL